MVTPKLANYSGNQPSKKIVGDSKSRSEIQKIKYDHTVQWVIKYNSPFLNSPTLEQNII